MFPGVIFSVSVDVSPNREMERTACHKQLEKFPHGRQPGGSRFSITCIRSLSITSETLLVASYKTKGDKEEMIGQRRDLASCNV